MPSCRIFDSSVDAGIPSLAAAPREPATLPRLRVNAASISSLSWSSSVPGSAGFVSAPDPPLGSHASSMVNVSEARGNDRRRGPGEPRRVRIAAGRGGSPHRAGGEEPRRRAPVGAALPPRRTARGRSSLGPAACRVSRRPRPVARDYLISSRQSVLQALAVAERRYFNSPAGTVAAAGATQGCPRRSEARR
jgi:hypothetical protein